MKMDILSTNFIRRRIQQNAERAFAQFVRCYARKKTEIILKKILVLYIPHPALRATFSRREKDSLKGRVRDLQAVTLKREDPRAIPEAFLLHAELVEHAEQKIRHRGVLRSNDMTVAFQRAAGAAEDNKRQWIVIVLIPVAHAASIKNHRMIQQGAVAVVCRSEFVDEVGQHGDVVFVDHREIVHVGLVVGVV